MKCSQCGNEFEAKRKDAKFCSGACRMRKARGVTDKPIRRVTDNVTDNPAPFLNQVQSLKR